MANSNLDLALIEFNVLQQVAKDARIPGWDDLSRADLVFALRKQGQGASAPARGAPSETGMVPIVSELLDVVRALSNEISQLRNVIETSKSSQENFRSPIVTIVGRDGGAQKSASASPGSATNHSVPTEYVRCHPFTCIYYRAQCTSRSKYVHFYHSWRILYRAHCTSRFPVRTSRTQTWHANDQFWHSW